MAMLVWNNEIRYQDDLKNSLIWMYIFWSLMTLFSQPLGKSL